MFMASNLKLYVKTGCPWCSEAREWLNARGYQFDEVDVRADPVAFNQMKQISGQTLSPTLVAGDLVLPDFDTGQLEAFLAEHGINP